MTSILTPDTSNRHAADQCTICGLEPEGRGPAVIRPMIQLRSIMDAGTPMTVTASDYADPERWWL